MNSPLLPAWTSLRCPVIGMLHAPPLPGSPRFAGDMQKIRDHVRRDVDALVAGGVHGLMLENFGDAPFFPARVPAITVAALTAVAELVLQHASLPLGINVLRNDGLSAIAIARTVGASFVRVNVFTGARVTDQGVIQGIAHDLLRERAALGAADLRILADASVKHSAPLGVERPLRDEIADMTSRGGADAVVISGSATGKETAPEDVALAKAAANGRPVLVGSGVKASNVGSLLGIADALIVGTSFKRDGRPENPIEPDRVRELIRAIG